MTSDTAKIRIRRRPRTTTLILLCAIIASWLGVVRLWIDLRDARDRIEAAEIRHESDITRAAKAIDALSKAVDLIDTAPLEADLCRFGARTDDFKLVLDVLIAEDRWPSRVALPAPLSDLKPWPCRGAHIGSIHDKPRVCK